MSASTQFMKNIKILFELYADYVFRLCISPADAVSQPFCLEKQPSLAYSVIYGGNILIGLTLTCVTSKIFAFNAKFSWYLIVGP